MIEIEVKYKNGYVECNVCGSTTLHVDTETVDIYTQADGMVERVPGRYTVMCENGHRIDTRKIDSTDKL